jgi:hypothetical protein
MSKEDDFKRHPIRNNYSVMKPKPYNKDEHDRTWFANGTVLVYGGKCVSDSISDYDQYWKDVKEVFGEPVPFHGILSKVDPPKEK